MKLLSLYRIDNVPYWLRPIYWVYGYGIGILFYLYILLIHFTSKIESNHPLPEGNFIICLWHESVWICFGAFARFRGHAWLNHPSWYMKPIHVTIRICGVKHLVLGSTGNDGRKAADELARYLRNGYSTVLIPDGPYGPPHVAKKGAAHLSSQTGVPILPVRLECAISFRLRGWDRKVVPLPFNKIRIHFGHPRKVKAETLDEDLRAITQELSYEPYSAKL